MRKQFTIFLILIFTLGLIPVNFSKAITQNLIDAEVQIVCTDGADNWFSGSGTIIDPKGIILTNRHVVEGAYKNICFIGFMQSISQEPNFGTKENPNLAEVKYITTTNDMDAAVLYLENSNNKSYPYVNIWNSNSGSLKFGDKIEVVGYPSIGGSTITYTSGDFSGFGSQSDNTHNYIKTTAVLEHGNSGGSAYNQRGEFVGIPSMVISGSLNSISYILSVDSIKKWLSGFLGNDYKQEIIEQKPIINEPSSITIQDDIYPPQMKGFNINYKIINDANDKKSKIQYFWNSKDVTDDNQISKYFYYYGEDVTADPVKQGKVLEANNNGLNYLPETYEITSTNEKYLIIKIQDIKGNISSSVIAPWEMGDIIGDGYLLSVYNNSVNNFSHEDKNVFNKYKGYFVTNNGMTWFINPKSGKKHLVYGLFDNNSLLYSLRVSQMFSDSAISMGISTSNLNKKPRNAWGNLLIEMLDDNQGVGGFYYIHPKTGGMYDFSGLTGDGNNVKIKNLISYLSIKISDDEINKLKTAPTVNSYYIDQGMVPLYIDGLIPTIADRDYAKKMSGKILLQVELRGQAWYVNPKNQKKYYMANGDEAFKIMRNLGVGIKNSDINKIKADKNYAKKFSGKIFLQVESKGEAYYIDFNGVAHYLKDGAAAYEVMRSLGSGITNNDLSKILEGSLQ